MTTPIRSAKFGKILFLVLIIVIAVSIKTSAASYGTLVEEADALQMSGRFDEAIAKFQKAETQCRAAGNAVSPEMQYILISMAACAVESEHPEIELSALKEALQIGDKIGFTEDAPEAVICFLLARNYIYSVADEEDLVIGKVYLERGLKARDVAETPEVKIYLEALRHKLAYIEASYLDDLDEIKEIAAREYAYFKSECPLPLDEITENIYESGILLSDCYVNGRFNEKGIEILDELEHIMRSVMPGESFMDLQAKKMTALSNIQRNGECIELGERLLRQVSETEDNYKAVSSIKYSLARSYIDVEREEEAIALINSIFENPYAGQLEGMDTSFLKSTIAMAHAYLEHYDEAEELCRELIEGGATGVALSEALWTRLLIANKSADHSELGYVEDLVSAYDQVGIDDVMYADTFLMFAENYRNAYQHQKALDMANRAVGLYEKWGKTDDINYFIAHAIRGYESACLFDLEGSIGFFEFLQTHISQANAIMEAKMADGDYERATYFMDKVLEAQYMLMNRSVAYLTEGIEGGEVTSDQISSAKDMMSQNRDGMLRLINGFSDETIVWLSANKPDRLARIYSYAIFTLRDLKEWEEEIAFIDSHIDEFDKSGLERKDLETIRNFALIHLGRGAELAEFVETNYQEVENELKKMLNAFTSAQRSEMWNSYFENINVYTEFASLSHDNPRLNGVAYNAALVSKGLLLQSDIDFETRVIRCHDDEVTELFAEWKRLEEEEPGSGASIERELLRRVGTNFEGNAFKIRWVDVRDALRPGEYAMEFRAVRDPGNTNYYAFLLGNGFESPRMIEICDSKTLGSLGSGNDFDFAALSRMVWSGFDTLIPEGSTIYFSPEFKLHSLPLENVPDFADADRLISDRWILHRVSSIRQVADVSKKNNDSGLHVEIYGGLSYSGQRDAIIQDYNENATIYRAAFDWDSEDLRASMSNIRDLPGSKREVDEIERLLMSHSLPLVKNDGLSGTEARFKATAGTVGNILHLSTHGFFLDAGKSSQARIGRLLNLGVSSGYDDALRASGLMMAGVNETLAGRVRPSECEDGLLTAKEISLLDLSKIDFAILSACETGIGAISGDGVFGLQRGFKLAGVKTIMMSLWKVDDSATETLMTEFYRNWIDTGDVSISLSKAREKVRTTPGWEHPRFWAAFVLLD